MAKKLTIDGILKHKKITDSQKDKNFYSKTFDEEIEIDCKNPEEIIGIFADKNESDYRKYLKVIYACCPIFKAPELREEYEVNEPYDIISKVFGDNISEVIDLGLFLTSKFGFLDEDTVKKLKKQ